MFGEEEERLQRVRTEGSRDLLRAVERDRQTDRQGGWIMKRNTEGNNNCKGSKSGMYVFSGKALIRVKLCVWLCSCECLFIKLGVFIKSVVLLAYL